MGDIDIPLSIIATVLALLSFCGEAWRIWRDRPRLTFYVMPVTFTNVPKFGQLKMMRLMICNVGYRPIILTKFMAFGETSSFTMGIDDEPAAIFGEENERFPTLLEAEYKDKSLEQLAKLFSAWLALAESFWAKDAAHEKAKQEFIKNADPTNERHLLAVVMLNFNENLKFFFFLGSMCYFSFHGFVIGIDLFKLNLLKLLFGLFGIISGVILGYILACGTLIALYLFIPLLLYLLSLFIFLLIFGLVGVTLVLWAFDGLFWKIDWVKYESFLGL